MSEEAGMRQFDFPQAVRIQINRERFAHPDVGVRQRMEILWLKACHEGHERIAQLAGVSRPTVQRVLDMYWTGGLAAVGVYHGKTPTSALAAFTPQLAAEFDRQPPHTTEEACQRIVQLTGVKRGPTQVRHFLHDTLHLRWRKTAAVPLPPKQTLPEHAAQQAAFLKDGA